MMQASMKQKQKTTARSQGWTQAEERGTWGLCAQRELRLQQQQERFMASASQEEEFNFEDLSQHQPERHGLLHLPDRQLMEGGVDLPPPNGADSDADDSENLTDEIDEEAPGECKAMLEACDEKFCTRLLFAFAIGLVDIQGRKLADLKEEPCSEIKQKNTVKPTSDGLKAEIVRRSSQLEIPIPKCKNWSIPRCMEYLEDNPIVNEEDRLFICEEEKKVCDMCMSDLKERKDLAANRAAGWTALEPHLRFIHCITDDSARTLLTTKDLCHDRASLDAGNSSARPPAWHEKLAELFNDQSNNYVSEAMPDSHESFANSIELPFDEKYGLMTAETAKSRFADMRAKTITVIAAWEKSGNGFGMPREEDDPDFGKVTEDSFLDGDNRAAFLKQCYDKIYILHFWAQSDNLGILSNVMSVLSKQVAGDCDGNLFTEMAAVQHRQKRVKQRKENEKQAKKFRVEVGSSLKALAVSSEAMAPAGIRENIQKLESTIDQLEIKWQTEEDTPLRSIYKKQKTKKKKHLKTLKQEARFLHDRLFKKDEKDEKNAADDDDESSNDEDDDENSSGAE